MDFQNRAGNKVGGGGVASFSQFNQDRRERLTHLAMETFDLSRDPYFMRNNIGSYECRLCLTIHTNEGSYLAHTQGKKHQTNLARRQLKDQAMNKQMQQIPVPNTNDIVYYPQQFQKIGRPGYKITKMKDANTLQRSILFEIDYPQIINGITPRYRVMSAFEQKVEVPDDKYQYVIFAAEPYENIAFKIPNYEIDNSEDKYLCNWDEETKVYTVQIYFRDKSKTSNQNNAASIPN